MSTETNNLDQERGALEAKRLKLKNLLLDRQLRLVENIDPVDGKLVDFDRIFRYRGMPLYPIWGNEQKQDRPQTIRTLQDLTWARNLSCYLAEYNPNASGLLRGLVSYTVASGSCVKVVSVDEDDEPPKMLSKKAASILKKFRRVNKWAGVEKEMEERLHKHGEFFLRLYPDEDNVTKARFIEPAQIKPPAGADSEGPWSWGILTDPGDTQTPRAYNVHDFQTNEDEEVEAQFVIHVKINVPRNAKRGIPSFWACHDELSGTAKLRHATREGEKIRASIAYIREWATASRNAIAALQDENFTDTINRLGDNGTEREVKVQKVEVGSVVDVPEGMKFVAPPDSPNSEAAGTSVTQSLQSVAARFQVPYWIVSGDPDATNFATSLTVESPFTKSIESDQSALVEGEVDLHHRVLEIAIEQNQLPADALDVIEVAVEFPSPVARNRLEETTRNSTLNQAGLLSKATWSAREDLERDTEKANLMQEASEEPAPAPTADQPPEDAESPSSSDSAEYARQT